MKTKAPSKAKSIVMLSFTGVLLAIMIAFTVVFVKLEPFFSLFLVGKALDSASREKGEALSSQIVEEGAVLLTNDNCLPLKESDITVNGEMRVNVFGWASTQWVMGGSGSGRATNNGNISKIGTGLLDALEKANIKYNTELSSMYRSFCNKRPHYAVGNGGALSVHDYEYCRLIEPPFSNYSETIKENALAFSDVAIVVIGRISGESIDCPTAQYKNYTGMGSRPTAGALAGAAVDTKRTYLEISTEEEEMLRYVADVYGKTIVLINNTNAMNLSFLRDIPGIDACMMIGGTGVNGASAIPSLLLGKKTVTVTDENGNKTQKTVDVSPSGKTVDTFVYDFSTNPSYAYTAMDGVTQYTGLKTTDGIYPYDGSTTNGNVASSVDNEKYPGVSYLDYVEGIYVGYKWYETADAEKFWNSDFAKQTWNVSSYDDVVQFPFGYGKSYSEFKWSARNWSSKDGKISVDVEVRNTGTVAAQETVQMYFTPPYSKGDGIEKSAVTLAAFAKTPVAVEPGQNQVLTLSFDIQDMASYDQTQDNGKYVLKNGTYTISLRTDSHRVAKLESGNATHAYTVGSTVVYDTYTGSNGTEKIHNLFTGDNISDSVAVDGSDSEQTIKWLSRSDFAGTFSTEKAAARAWKSALKKNNIYGQADVNEWETAHKTDATIKTGQNNNIKIYDSSTNQVNSIGLTYGDPNNFDDTEMWDKLLDQLTVDEMLKLVLHGYVHEEPIDSIGKPKTISYDGPSQVGSFNAKECGVGYPNPTVLAQSWNQELATSFGLAAGAETRKMSYHGWYAPGTNLHRSAFGGRNYEYYSEDTYLSGVFCAAVVRGALNSGTYTYIKHFIGYDQESMRDGLYCWMTEQALRETYLRPYKMAVDVGATGIMTSYGRVGAVWSGGSEALLTDLLRNEWGYKGTVITDYSDHHKFMNGDQMIRNGGDLWMDGYETGVLQFNKAPSNFSNAFKSQLRNASKHIIYMYLNAAYEEVEYIEYVKEHGEGMTIARSTTSETFKWWWLVFAIVDVLLVGGTAVLGVFGTLGLIKVIKVGKAGGNTEAQPQAPPQTDDIMAADDAQPVEPAEPDEPPPTEEPEQTEGPETE